MSYSPNLLPLLQMFVGTDFLWLPPSSTHPSWVGSFASILIWAYAFFSSSKVWKPSNTLNLWALLLCSWQATPFVSFFNNFWTFTLTCLSFYPLFELYFFFLSLNIIVVIGNGDQHPSFFLNFFVSLSFVVPFFSNYFQSY